MGNVKESGWRWESGEAAVDEVKELGRMGQDRLCVSF